MRPVSFAINRGPYLAVEGEGASDSQIKPDKINKLCYINYNLKSKDYVISKKR